VHQRILLNLGVHLAAVHLLELPLTHPSQQGAFEMICSHTFTFLTAFCRNNPDNQAALFSHLDLFLKFVESSLECGLLLPELISDNRNLCSRLTERSLRAIVTAMAEGYKYAHFISFLENACLPKGRPLKCNQMLVLKLLIEKQQDALVLYKDDMQKYARNTLIDALDYLHNPSCPILFHIRQLDLITKCSRGKIYEAEVKCQSLFHMNEVCSQLLDPFSLRAIKAEFLRFLDEVYLETEMKMESILGDLALWKIFSKHIYVELLTLVKCWETGTTPPPDLPIYVFGHVCPFLVAFFAQRLPALGAKNVRSDARTVCNGVQDCLSRLFAGAREHASSWTPDPVHLAPFTHTDASRAALLQPRLSVGAALRALADAHYRGSRTTDQLDARLAEYAELLEATELARPIPIPLCIAPEDELINNVKRFGRFFEHEFEPEREIDLLASVFSEHVDTVMPRLLGVLAERNVSSHLVVTTLRALNVILKRVKDDDEHRYQTQCIYSELGLTALLVELITSGRDEYVRESLCVGCRLLHGGNKAVQDTFLQLFTSGSADERFFFELRGRIRLAIPEIRDRKIFYLRKSEGEVGSGVRSVAGQFASFPERGFIHKILRFLQLLCEGHNLDLQRYLLSQTHNVHSYDLVSETAAFLEALEREVDVNNANIAIQLFETLTEYCQGPCYENQFALIRTKLCNSANWILENEHPHCEPQQVTELKLKALTTLLSLLEGVRTLSIPRQMLPAINPSMLESNMRALYEQLSEDALRSHELDPEERTALEDASELLYQYHFLVCTLREYDVDGRLSNVSSFPELRQGTCRLEIVRDDHLERMYFRRPVKCAHLPDRSKEELKWNIKRDNQQDKIIDFFERSEFLVQEMELRDELSKNAKFSFLSRRERALQNISFLFAILINFVIIWTYTAPPATYSDAEPLPTPVISRLADILIFVLGIAQVVVSTLVLFIFRRLNEPLILRRAWRRKIRSAEREVADRHSDQSPCNATAGGALASEESSSIEDALPLTYETIARDLYFYTWSCWFLAQDPLLLYNVLRVVFAVLGVALHSSVGCFFFSFHLLDVIARFKLLQYVIKSVTLNGQSIVLTVLLAFVVLYFYAIFGFLFFRDKFVVDDEYVCESMLMCLTSVINLGVRQGGGIGDVMDATHWDDPDNMTRIVYDSTFFFLVIVILLNIIFGIIIDTFGELRQDNKNILDDMENTCFICGINRYTFDRESKDGFETHARQDHNMWNYLYLIMHLRDKDSTEFTGPEQYVFDLLNQRNYSFIPNMRALCLAKPHDDREDATARLEVSLKDLNKYSRKTMKQLAGDIKRTRSELGQQLFDSERTEHDLVRTVHSELSERMDGVIKLISGVEISVEQLRTVMDHAARDRSFRDDVDRKFRKRLLRALRSGGGDAANGVLSQSVAAALLSSGSEGAVTSRSSSRRKHTKGSRSTKTKTKTKKHSSQSTSRRHSSDSDSDSNSDSDSDSDSDEVRLVADTGQGAAHLGYMGGVAHESSADEGTSAEQRRRHSSQQQRGLRAVGTVSAPQLEAADPALRPALAHYGSLRRSASEEEEDIMDALRSDSDDVGNDGSRVDSDDPEWKSLRGRLAAEAAAAEKERRSAVVKATAAASSPLALPAGFAAYANSSGVRSSKQAAGSSKQVASSFKQGSSPSSWSGGGLLPSPRRTTSMFSGSSDSDLSGGESARVAANDPTASNADAAAGDTMAAVNTKKQSLSVPSPRATGSLFSGSENESDDSHHQEQELCDTYPVPSDSRSTALAEPACATFSGSESSSSDEDRDGIEAPDAELRESTSRGGSSFFSGSESDSDDEGNKRSVQSPRNTHLAPPSPQLSVSSPRGNSGSSMFSGSENESEKESTGLAPPSPQLCVPSPRRSVSMFSGSENETDPEDAPLAPSSAQVSLSSPRGIVGSSMFSGSENESPLATADHAREINTNTFVVKPQSPPQKTELRQSLFSGSESDSDSAANEQPAETKTELRQSLFSGSESDSDSAANEQPAETKTELRQSLFSGSESDSTDETEPHVSGVLSLPSPRHESSLLFSGSENDADEVSPRPVSQLSAPSPRGVRTSLFSGSENESDVDSVLQRESNPDPTAHSVAGSLTFSGSENESTSSSVQQQQNAPLRERLFSGTESESDRSSADDRHGDARASSACSPSFEASSAQLATANDSFGSSRIDKPDDDENKLDFGGTDDDDDENDKLDFGGTDDDDDNRLDFGGTDESD